MGGIVKALDVAMASNNPEKVAETMEKFEKQFENLDVRSSFVADAMSNQAAISTPENEVTDLMQQVGHVQGGSKLWSHAYLSNMVKGCTG